MSAAKASPFRWAPSFVSRPGVRKCGVLSFRTMLPGAWMPRAGPGLSRQQWPRKPFLLTRRSAVEVKNFLFNNQI